MKGKHLSRTFYNAFIKNNEGPFSTLVILGTEYLRIVGLNISGSSCFLGLYSKSDNQEEQVSCQKLQAEDRLEAL